MNARRRRRSDHVAEEMVRFFSAKPRFPIYSGGFAGPFSKWESYGVSEIRWRDLSSYTGRFPAQGILASKSGKGFRIFSDYPRVCGFVAVQLIAQPQPTQLLRGFQSQLLDSPIEQVRCKENVRRWACQFVNPAELTRTMSRSAKHAQHSAIQGELIDAPRITIRCEEKLIGPGCDANRPW